MLNCKDASRLVSESLDHRLSWWQRINLWMHVRMCGVCWGFQRALLRIHREASLHPGQEEVERDSAEPGSHLTDESRERIKRVLESGPP